MSVREQYMIVSDVDGTLLGDDRALDEFTDWLASRRDQFRLVYNSGRFPSLVRESIKHSGLPEPDALIGGVGTQIEMFASARPFEGWPIFQGYWDAQVVRTLLASDSRLKLQPERFLSECKVSYLVEDASPIEIAGWLSRLTAAGLSLRHIYSSKRDLDFLPRGCDKGEATAFLARYWGFADDHVIACGDTANDISMFAHSFLGVVVGNALDELKALDSPSIYHATAHHAAGVQEGICHWLAKVERELPAAKSA